MTKMTYAQAIDFAVENIDNIEVIEKLQALKEQLGKRSASKGLTKTQKENEGVMEKILFALEEIGSPVTVTELIKAGEGLDGYTNQKISALLRKLVEAGKVSKVIEGKKAVFCIA